MPLAAKTISIRYASTDVVVPLVLWGYKTTIEYPFTITKLSNGKYTKWDNGTSFDRRYCSCSWLLQKADAETLLNVFNKEAQGRNVGLTLKLGTNSGFYPFGFDKGSSGNFTCALKSCIPGASQGHPADLFQVDCELVSTGTFPSYSIPSGVNEGNLTIGTVDLLRYPEGMHTQGNQYKQKTVDTYGFNSYGNDAGELADCFEASLALELLPVNMTRLIDFLSGASGRATAIDIIPPANAYLFGIENDSTDTYPTTWLDKTIETVHDNFNTCSTTLNFSLN